MQNNQNLNTNNSFQPQTNMQNSENLDTNNSFQPQANPTVAPNNLKSPDKKNFKPLILVFVAILVIAVSVGGYFIYQNTQTASKNKNEISSAFDDEKFSTIKELFQKADLIKDLETKNELTLFLPTNEAFESVDPSFIEGLNKEENKSVLRDILNYHATERKISFENLKSIDNIQTINGENLIPVFEQDVVYLQSAILAEEPKTINQGFVYSLNSILIPSSVDVVGLLNGDAESQASPEIPEDIKNLDGNFAGQSSFYSKDGITSSANILDGFVSLSGSGSLEIFNNPELQLNGKYPEFQILIDGEITKNNNDYKLENTFFDLTFFDSDAEITEVQIADLKAKLIASGFNYKINQDAVELGLELSLDGETLKLKSDQEIIFDFSGQKQASQTVEEEDFIEEEGSEEEVEEQN
jgi:uncharacterized surface protein with fasciclin (FAS1) repeats